MPKSQEVRTLRYLSWSPAAVPLLVSKAVLLSQLRNHRRLLPMISLTFYSFLGSFPLSRLHGNTVRTCPFASTAGPRTARTDTTATSPKASSKVAQLRGKYHSSLHSSFMFYHCWRFLPSCFLWVCLQLLIFWNVCCVNLATKSDTSFRKLGSSHDPIRKTLWKSTIWRNFGGHPWSKIPFSGEIIGNRSNVSAQSVTLSIRISPHEEAPCWHYCQWLKAPRSPRHGRDAAVHRIDSTNLHESAWGAIAGILSSTQERAKRAA